MTIIRSLLRFVCVRCKLSFTVVVDDYTGLLVRCPGCGEVNKVTR